MYRESPTTLIKELSSAHQDLVRHKIRKVRKIREDSQESHMISYWFSGTAYASRANHLACAQSSPVVSAAEHCCTQVGVS